MARYEQIKEMQKFIHKKILQNQAYNKDKDLVVLCGDFNQNAAPMAINQKEMYDEIKAEERYKPIM